MSNLLKSEDYGLKIYNRFPPKYIEDDSNRANLALKRYLESLSDGGFKYAIDEINGLTNLIDPDTVKADILPILFEHYGLDIFNGIPEEYLRYLLPKLGEVWSKKGSLSVIEFITSSLTGIKTITSVSYVGGNPVIDIKLEMDYNIGSYFPDATQFKRLISNFIPFYCDPNLIYYYMFYEQQVLSNSTRDTMVVNDNISEDGSFNMIPASNAILGKAVLGKAILGKSSYIEHKDTVKEAIVENVSISSHTPFFGTNLYNSLLNTTFTTNGFSDADKIIINGETTIIVV